MVLVLKGGGDGIMGKYQYLFKGIVVVVIAAYIISPVDLVPGPVDDILLALITVAVDKKIGGK